MILAKAKIVVYLMCKEKHGDISSVQVGVVVFSLWVVAIEVASGKIRDLQAGLTKLHKKPYLRMAGCTFVTYAHARIQGNTTK